MDIKKKLKNKTFVVTMVAVLVGFVYQALSILEIVPKISESEIMNLSGLLINMLAMLGILVDPNTDGIKDGK